MRPAAAMVIIDDLDAAGRVTRPLAVLDDNGVLKVFLWGTPEEVAASSARLGGVASEGHRWPADPQGRYRWSLRVPPALTEAALHRLSDGWRHLAVHGAGDIRASSDDAAAAPGLRDWAEGVGGALVMVTGPSPGGDGFDPWGTPPPGLDIQRRLIAQFDPARIINPGRLPGGI
jgi:hypothetical protein